MQERVILNLSETNFFHLGIKTQDKVEVSSLLLFTPRSPHLWAWKTP